MRVLDRYIVVALGRYIALSMAVLLVLMALFLFVNEQGWVGPGRYGQLQAARFVLMQLPATALQFLPVAALLGALLAMGQLARGSEITVMRAAGISIARIAGSVALAGLLLLPLAAATGEWIAPSLAQVARVNKALQRNDSLSLSQGAAWLRDGQRLLRSDGQGGVTVFELEGSATLSAVAVAAATRELDDGAWQLLDVAETRFGPDTVTRGAAAARTMQSAAGADLFQFSRREARQQSLRELHGAIRLLEQRGQDTLAQRFAFWSGIARLAAIPLAMLLAVPLLLGFLRTAEGGARATLGLAVGLIYFIAQRMVESGTVAFGLDPLLLAWLPTLLLGGAVALLLWRARSLSVA
jgi:lipopolysaccharide export system permease protein